MHKKYTSKHPRLLLLSLLTLLAFITMPYHSNAGDTPFQKSGLGFRKYDKKTEIIIAETVFCKEGEAFFPEAKQHSGASVEIGSHILNVDYINGYRVSRGIRPPMQITSSDSAAWHPGTIIIKFNHELTPHLKEHPATVDRSGFVTFQLEKSDSLNKRYGVSAFEQYFLSPALSNRFSERHKAWGFHLWYKLQTDPGADIPAMISDYLSLPEIEIAVPDFRIVHHGAEFLNHGYEPGFDDSGEYSIGVRPGEDGYLHKSNESLLNVISPRAMTQIKPNCVHEVLSCVTERTEGGWLPDDPFFSNQWALQNTGQYQGTPGADISQLQAWEIETGHADVIVAVIDDGIDYNHEDLAGNMWHMTGYNFTNNSYNIIPGNHGTIVGSVVAAVSENGIGISGIAGGSGNNDGVRLMSLQVFSEGGNSGFHIAPIFAADNGAAISQNSWGYSTPGHYNPAVHDAIDYFNENGGGGVLEGGITLTSAGNSNSSEPFYPAFYPGVFSVTATNNQDQKAWYSNFGDYHDLAAPGGETNVIAERGILGARVNSSYGYSQGTSLSCPQASGVAALLVSYAYRNNHILTNNQVWDYLIENTDDINEYNPEYHDLLGAGRLNAFKVLEAATLELGLIPNPGNFEAIAIDDQHIQLNWVPNLESHEVMLVFSHEDVIGSPVSGTLYETGSVLPGGGTVIYRGHDQSFVHTGLNENTHYHYKAFSYNNNYEYSIGRKATALTLGPNLIVKGVYNKYFNIPLSQLPQSIELQAAVKNTGLQLNNPTNIGFSVPRANYSGSSQLNPPLDTGEETLVTAEPPWITGNLKRGSYTIFFEAGTDVSLEEYRTDSITIHVTDSLYGRDNGNIINGIGSNSGPIILGMKYEIQKPAAVAAVQIQWPDLLFGELDFRVAIYEIDDDHTITRTAFVSELLTRTPEMRNSTHHFNFQRVANLLPGNYMVAFKQLTSANLTVGFDDAKNGHFYRSNVSTNPVSFPHKHAEYGNLALRMILYETDIPTSIAEPRHHKIPRVWYHQNIIYVENPNESMQLLLYDVNGRILKRFSYGKGSHSYPLSLPQGLYILNFESNPYVQPVKIIVQ